MVKRSTLYLNTRRITSFYCKGGNANTISGNLLNSREVRNDSRFQEQWQLTESCLTFEPEQMQQLIFDRMKAKTERVQPPFPTLPNFIIAAMIMSYTGYQDEIT